MSNKKASLAETDGPKATEAPRVPMKAGSRSGSGAASVIEHLGEEVRLAEGGPVAQVEEPPDSQG